MSAAPRIYLFDNGPSAARVLQRPVVAALAAAGFEVAVACNRDDSYLFDDLVGPQVSLLPAPLPASPRGALLDLAALCPARYLAIDMNLGRYRDTQAPQWCSVATICNRQLARHGIEFQLDAQADAPMLDFAHAGPVPQFTRPTVYLETRIDQNAQTHFVFDYERMLAVAPEYDFWCTQPPPLAHARLLDGSRGNLVQQAQASEHCALLLGTTWSPFVVTLSSANRSKPKAVCGHDRHLYCGFWDYANNPLEYLATMEQLADFLRSHATARRERARMLVGVTG